ncbi:S-layer homology domain-containing protein [Paenibacillus sp. GSMTC-2017]|uniref:S-layer homology domain-containing protein n=1 Tax=Paenibacillus sp. GSMTC-2017 TaxID=2794350 RepID=UPI0018D6DC6B|nr:S-layer homology domain-containing protein [Paenibacillus sp. GSMTC-2017]MBH5316418.1 S-layer homology domain-containing protein [Paenibacillus sp. GSMTC-2017]
MFQLKSIGSPRSLLNKVTVRLLVVVIFMSLFSSLLTTDASATVQNNVGPDGSIGWTYCAEEGHLCTFIGTKEVRYWGYDTTTSTTVGYVSKIATNYSFCATTEFGRDPSYGIAKKCYYRDLQLDSGDLKVSVNDLNKTVSVTFNVYAKQASTVEDLKNKISIKRTNESSFTALGENETVVNSSSSSSSSTFKISFNESLVGLHNVIKVDAGAFVDHAGNPYNYDIEIKDFLYTPPAVTSDSTENYTTNDIDLTFVDDSFWREAITDVSVGGNALVKETEYTIRDEVISIKANVLKKGIQSISIKATGYPEVVVNQSIIKLFIGAGAGTISDPYLISTADELNDVREHLEEDKYFKLIADVDLSSYPNWEPIGSGTYISANSFHGNIDGNSYKISNLQLDRRSGSAQGLFGNISNSSSISNLKLQDVKVIGADYTGALVGISHGKISNSYATGTVGGTNYVGGLVGFQQFGSTISNSYFSGSIDGYYEVGGLVGRNQNGSINNSYNLGAVSGYNSVGGLVGLNAYGIVSNSYNAGVVKGANQLGGLVSNIYGGSISNSFYDKDTAKQSDTGKGDGKTTAEMKEKSTFSGWDFTTEWYLVPGQYPKLWVFTNMVKGTEGGSTKLIHVAKGMEYTINDGAYISIQGTEVDNISVNAGDKIAIRVAATDTEVASTPHILTVHSSVISSKSTDATLATLSLSGVTINPSFDRDTMNYTANVPNNVTSAIVSAVASDSKASIKATDLGSKTLDVGINTISVHVTSQDGTKTALYTVAVTREATSNQPNNSGGGGGGDPSTFISKDGKLTLPTGKTGEVSVDNDMTLLIPADATNRELIITVDKVKDSQKLLAKGEILISTIYEILKNFPENFTKPVTITFTFDPAKVKSNQKAVVFYFDEMKRVWEEVPGGKISGNRITVSVNHFTKFAVFAVDQPIEVPTQETKPSLNVNDINGHWAKDAIKQALTSGIVKGYSDGTFMPNKAMTRAEFTVMLMNTLNVQEAGDTLAFTDVDQIGDWAKSSIAQAVKAGYISGYQDDTFRPNDFITRAEMAVIVAKAAGLSLEVNVSTDFADDNEIPVWAKGAVAAIKKLGFIEGNGSNLFKPAANTTRAEALTVLLKGIELKK